jgi:chemotaxis protein CheD
MGDLQVLVNEGTLFTIGLGSCVAIALYDPHARIGGLAHVMLPDSAHGADDRLGRFAPTAVPRLIELMEAAGARSSEVFARIAGGAAMFAELMSSASARLGERNVAAVKAALQQAGVPLHGEDVGGTFGRSVFFDANDGSLIIRVVQRADVLL